MIRDRDATTQDIKETLENNSLGRNTYLNNFISSLNSINHNTIIAIDGNWGSGKTYFVKSLEYIANNSAKFHNITKEVVDKFKEKYEVFYFNAWENDDLPPTESVLYRLAKDFWGAREALADLATGIVKGIMKIPVAFISGGSMSMDDFTRGYTNRYDDRINNIIGLHKQIDDLLYNNYEESKKDILFIVDDLDRCNPAFAVNLLESIKHHFTSEHVVFVVCANNSELQHTIKKYYGEHFDGMGYLNRFYDIIFNLPAPDTRRYLAQRFKDINLSYIDKEVALDVAKAENMSLRQMNRYFSSLELLSWFFDGPSLSHEGKIGRCVKFVFIPIACALKILRPEEYILFITGKGEDILEHYIDISEQVSQLDKEAETGESIMPLIDCYNEIFKESTHHYQCAEAFTKATSLLGYSIEIDNK